MILTLFLGNFLVLLDEYTILKLIKMTQKLLVRIVILFLFTGSYQTSEAQLFKKKKKKTETKAPEKPKKGAH